MRIDMNSIFDGFGGYFDMGDTFTCVLEITLGEKIVQKQELNQPEQMLKNQYVQLVQQLAREKAPMSFKMKFPKYDEKSGDKLKDDELKYYNKPMERAMEDKHGKEWREII